MKRLYEQLAEWHFKDDNLMLFLAGPRQCGKTTCSEMVASRFNNATYLNWDEKTHREKILLGTPVIAETAGIDQLSDENALIIFDELHKYKDWKQFLKGFYDLYKSKTRIFVTGSSRLDVFKRGGDSLMGRYFLYRMHPLSISEIMRTALPKDTISPPQRIDNDAFENLLQFGGYPKPFLRSNTQFSNRWQNLRLEQLVYEDIRDGTRIQELAQLEMLTELLKIQGAQRLSYAKLANRVHVAVDTITRWIQVLNAFYYCFTIKPWHKNIARSLIKEPKIYLWDWSLIENEGLRFENFVASQLLKATQFWTDQGLGNYDLFYIHTTERQEVDFLVTKDNTPWFLVEAKLSGKQAINPYLYQCHQQLKTEHAFQVCRDLPFIEKNCFEEHEPIKVPAKTFLSQLI